MSTPIVVRINSFNDAKHIEELTVVRIICRDGAVPVIGGKSRDESRRGWKCTTKAYQSVKTTNFLSS